MVVHLEALYKARAARGAVPPSHSDNNSCPTSSLLNVAEEYLDEHDIDYSTSGSSL